MNLSDYIKPVPNMSYYVVLIDYGKNGFEAVVHPEHTKRETIEYVREVIGDGLPIVHIKWVEGNFCTDVTEEIVSSAVNAMALEAAE